LPPDGGPEFNRLVFESSPYLLQHARNPVDWYPWGDAAFARARAENKPLLLSVGYSTCHWCHVMEVECFEQQDVADILNEHYVCIKVDREERPDIDSIYVTAAQVLNGHAGWPNNVWLLPDGRPFFATTYVPKEDSNETGPGFKTLALQIARLYGGKREQIEADANEVAEALKAHSAGQATAEKALPARTVVDNTLKRFAAQFDGSYGGFGIAPKFPPHSQLALISYELRRKPDEELAKMLRLSLNAMANGGLRDQLGGGFHRYSTDAQWQLPHFEKMLYDNAQLVRSYTDGWLLLGDDYYAEVARVTCDWLLSEMQGPEGGFYSAWDADSEGVEGKYYVWTMAEVKQALGAEDAALYAQVYHLQERGNFREEATGEYNGANVLLLGGGWDKAAVATKLDEPVLRKRIGASNAKLLELRKKRVLPHLDDKVLTDWNGLTISGLAYAGRHLREPRYVEAAGKTAEFLLTEMRDSDGRLLHSYRAGKASVPAFLEDYANLCDGLLELYQSTAETRWLEEAEKIAAELEKHFRDEGSGAYFSAPNDGETLLLREKPYLDQVVPPGNAVAARTLARLRALTGEAKYRENAEAVLGAFAGQIAQSATGTAALQLALAIDLDGATSAGSPGEPLALSSNTSAETAQPVPDYASLQEPVAVQAFISTLKAGPGDKVSAAFKVKVADGFHVNSDAPAEGELVATVLRLKEGLGATLTGVEYPRALLRSYGGRSEELRVYEGEVWIVADVLITEAAKPGALRLDFELTTQPCDATSCQLPQTHSMPLTLVVQGGEFKPEPRHPLIFATQTGRGAGLLGFALRYVWLVAFIIVGYLGIKLALKRKPESNDEAATRMQ
jgi:uncharacterized protein YyaL (SSP411 family)